MLDNLPLNCITGVEKFDIDHAIAIKILDELAESENTRHSLIILDKLIGEWIVHMTTEEQFMKDISFPNLAEHAADHSRFLDSLKRIKYCIDNGTLAINRRLISRLKFVVVHHIETMDVKYGEYLRNK